jgi:hypothetical protein
MGAREADKKPETIDTSTYEQYLDEDDEDFEDDPMILLERYDSHGARGGAEMFQDDPKADLKTMTDK